MQKEIRASDDVLKTTLDQYQTTLKSKQSDLDKLRRDLKDRMGVTVPDGDNSTDQIKPALKELVNQLPYLLKEAATTFVESYERLGWEVYLTNALQYFNLKRSAILEEHAHNDDV